MKVIDNFLPSYNFKQIESSLLGTNFSWYYNDEMLPENHPQYNPNLFQFTHTFHAKYPPWNGKTSSFYPLLEICQSQLGVKDLHRIKANLNPRTMFHKHGGYHSDLPNVTTAIFYVNSNNGWTQFKSGGRVKCVKNRVVIFDSNLEHEGVTSNNEKVKVVINFNYEG